MSGQNQDIPHGPGRQASPVLITGGAGFIGTNLADRLARRGRRVRLVDNLSRSGAEENAAWLHDRHAGRIELQTGDVREPGDVRRAVQGVGAVFHFAAQVAVTTGLADPVSDFDVNARGTLNVLEAVRAQPMPPPLLFTSTNKVFGSMEGLGLDRRDRRYEPMDPDVRRQGLRGPGLNFHTPYGCSKGAADQYVLDYARSYHLPAMVLRMSCIYGPHQQGTEDQGWVAHFARRNLRGEAVTIFGDGRQVRDVLYVDDLVDAMGLAMRRADRLAGRAFTLGGGPTRTLSLRELARLLEELTGQTLPMNFQPWREGDQRYYVSDLSDFQEATGWIPRTLPRQGVKRLVDWLREREAPVASKSVVPV